MRAHSSAGRASGSYPNSRSNVVRQVTGRSGVRIPLGSSMKRLCPKDLFDKLQQDVGFRAYKFEHLDMLVAEGWKDDLKTCLKATDYPWLIINPSDTMLGLVSTEQISLNYPRLAFAFYDGSTIHYGVRDYVPKDIEISLDGKIVKGSYTPSTKSHDLVIPEQYEPIRLVVHRLRYVQSSPLTNPFPAYETTYAEFLLAQQLYQCDPPYKNL